MHSTIDYNTIDVDVFEPEETPEPTSEVATGAAPPPVYTQFKNLGHAIVCNCKPKNGYDWPARLNFTQYQAPNAWVCAQSPSRGFWLAIEDTAKAPEPQKRGPLSDTQIEPPTVKVSQYSRALEMMAADANVDLDEMTPELLADFRAFCKWFRKTYEFGKLTPELLAEKWPVFAQELATAVPA